MDEATRALRTNILQIRPNWWNMLFRTHHASICQYDALTLWMSTLIKHRRKEILQRHAKLQAEDRSLQIQYPIVRIQFCDLERGCVSKLTYQEGLFGQGVCFEDLLDGAFASAAIPLAFEAQAVGWRGLISRAGVDGCVAGMGMRPNNKMVDLFKDAYKPNGGDMIVANSTDITSEFTPLDFTQQNRLKVHMHKAISASISAIIKQLCVISITDTRADWISMFPRAKVPYRIFNHNGMSSEHLQPNLNELTAGVCIVLY